MFGSDFPNAPTDCIEYFTTGLDEHVVEETKQEIWVGNALKLFPRLGKCNEAWLVKLVVQ